MLRDLSDTEAAKLLINEVRDDDRLVITNVHAKSAPKRCCGCCSSKCRTRNFATVVTAVLCTRLIRKLCDACKVATRRRPTC